MQIRETLEETSKTHSPKHSADTQDGQGVIRHSL
jgi:hypothetical protein